MRKATLFVAFAATLGASAVLAKETRITLIHMGDVHGHLVPRPHLRPDLAGHFDRADAAAAQSHRRIGATRMEGGLARMYTQIERIRREQGNTLLLNTGDTVQGSAEALFTKGQALVDVLNNFGIDAFAPGNWEFVYGTERFLELFAGKDGAAPKAPWNAVAANVFYNGAPYESKGTARVLPPYLIKEVDGIRVGLLGLTTDRGPQVVGSSVTRGFRFLRNGTEIDTEVRAQVEHLRNVEKVDLLVLLSEMGLANNIRIANAIAGIDAVLSSDMHEVTPEPVVTGFGTVVVEEGMDGTRLGELTFHIHKDGKSGRVEKKSWRWKMHVIDERITEHPGIAAQIAEIRRPYLAGSAFAPKINPFNGTLLKQPIDTVVGYTQVPLYRYNFAGQDNAGLVEGSSHNFLADAFRQQTGADIGAIRGFRYGTHVAPGPIKLEDLFHYIPIGPMIAKGNISGQQLKNQIENAINGSINPDITQWTGGWFFNFSGVRMEVNPYAPAGQRATKIEVLDRASGTYQPLDTTTPGRTYSYASYFYSADPNLINTVTATSIQVLKAPDGSAIDGTEVVANYLASPEGAMVNPVMGRIKLLQPLPTPKHGYPEVQPLQGGTP